jgi:hypothetical protein
LSICFKSKYSNKISSSRIGARLMGSIWRILGNLLYLGVFLHRLGNVLFFLLYIMCSFAVEIN